MNYSPEIGQRWIEEVKRRRAAGDRTVKIVQVSGGYEAQYVSDGARAWAPWQGPFELERCARSFSKDCGHTIVN